MAAVVPRVLPLFVTELQNSSPDVKTAHLQCFLSNLPKVFASKIEDEDFSELLLQLFSLANLAESESDQANLLLSLRLLRAFFVEGTDWGPRVFRVLEHLVQRYAPKEEEIVPPASPEKNRPQSSTQEKSESGIEEISPVKDSSPSPAERPKQQPPPETSVFHIDAALDINFARPLAIELLSTWDSYGIDVSVFTLHPEVLHVYLPVRRTCPLRVYRDFVFCTPRPKLNRTWGSAASVHIKTNIKAQSDVMYRFLLEGYNYGVNAVLLNDVVGYTNRRWDELGNMAKYGWPEGWDSEMCNDYAPGATVSQYYSSDRYLVLKLRAKSFFNVGFSVSAWLVFHGLGNGFKVCAEIFHQDDDL